MPHPLAPAEPRSPERDRAVSPAFRADIEGLRGLAVLAVVLYHAGVPQVSGGYVGVDVFFVLSGYLITGLIAAELSRTGRFSFIGFYARRAGRILPAATVVLVVTVGCSAASLPPLQARSVSRDAVASALFVSNYRFAATGTDYLADTAPSPLQHYWSLAIEEQFYLLWPALLVLLVLAGRRWRLPVGLPATVLAALALASFAAGVRLTGSNPPLAYFALASRGWELAAGGLLCLALPLLRRCPAPAARLVGWAGLVLLGFSIVRLDAGTAFPGWAALLPVTGTLAAVGAGVRAGTGRASPTALLGRAPLRRLGRISYSWYLWHWPALVLAPVLLGRPLRLPQSLAVLAATAVLAALTLTVIENPVRSSTVLRLRPGLAVLLGGALVLGSTAFCYLARAGIASVSGHGTVAAPAALGGPAAPGSQPDNQPAGPHSRPAARSTASDALSIAQARITAALRAGLAQVMVPANLDPALDQAAGDKAAPFLDGCNVSWTVVDQPPCTYTGGASQVVLFGDSHAAQWFPALDQLARGHGWRLESLTKTTCPPNELAVFSPYLGRPYRECSQWRAAVLDRIRAERPALVVLGVARHYSSDYRITVYDRGWDAALARTVTDLRATGAAVLVMGPTPKPPADVPSCLSAHTRDATSCTFDYRSAVQAAGMAGERRAVEQAGGFYLDVPSWICTGGRCAVLVGNLLVYRDDNHLTTSFTRWLAPALLPVVEAALRARH